jgi:hypothetical protein
MQDSREKMMGNLKKEGTNLLQGMGRIAIVFGIASILTLAWVVGMNNYSNSWAAVPASSTQNTKLQIEASEITTIYVATDADYWPFSYISNTQLLGHDIDLMNAIDAEISATVVFTIVPWDGIFLGLISDKYDAIISGVSVTPQREEFIDFTLPYLGHDEDGLIAIALQQGDHYLRSQLNTALWQLHLNGTLETNLSNVASDLPEADLWLPDWLTTTITADTQSTLVYTDSHGGKTTINFPVGAVTETIDLLFIPVDSVTVPSGFAFLDYAFELDAYRNGVERLQSLAFQQAVMVTIYYTDTNVIGLEESSLVLWHWNETLSDWEDAACGPYSYHPEDNWFSVPICHLSRFAAFGEGYKIYLPLVKRSE